MQTGYLRHKPYNINKKITCNIVDLYVMSELIKFCSRKYIGIGDDIKDPSKEAKINK